MKLLVIFLSVFGLTNHALAQLQMGEVPPRVVIKGEDGGRTDGKDWDSSMITGKVMSLFYVDPDEKDSNPIMEDAFQKENFPKDKYQSIGIINMDATWMPNFAIASALESKQEKFPEVVYVKDMKKVMVSKWGLKDDAYNTLLFDRSGKLIFQHVGVLDEKKTAELMQLIRDNL